MTLRMATLVCVVSWITVACGESPPAPTDGATADIISDSDSGPAADTPYRLTEAVLPVWQELLLAEQVDVLAVSRSGLVIAGSAAGLWRIDGLEARAVETAGQIAPETIVAMTELPDGAIVIGSADGLSTLSGTTLTPSPLNALLGDVKITGLASTGTEEESVLWIGATDGLHRWSNGQLSRVEPAGLETAGAQLADQADGTVWVIAGGDVYRIETASGDVEAWSELRDRPAVHVTTARDGRVWLTTTEGVWWRAIDGQWHQVGEDVSVDLALAHRAADRAWWLGADRAWQVLGDEVTPTDAPISEGARATDAAGRLIVATPDGVFRFGPGRSILLDGFPDDGVIVTLTDVIITPDEATHVTDITLLVDGVEAALGEGWTFSLDPETLGQGPHTLKVEVAYDDVAATTLEIPFEVRRVTWADDIQPLMLVHCAACHGETGAVKIKLFAPEQWVTLYDTIVASVESTMMPPGGGLDSDLIDLIGQWGTAGFPID